METSGADMESSNVPRTVHFMNISRLDTKSIPDIQSPAGVDPAGLTGASKQPAAQNAPSDQVQLTGMSRYLAAALNGSPAQVAKVSELGAAVSSGKYRVDADAVSGSLIQHAIEFGGGSYSAVAP
jgi:flagellar biosynthesis anti-sigma factor FlgM